MCLISTIFCPRSESTNAAVYVTGRDPGIRTVFVSSILYVLIRPSLKPVILKHWAITSFGLAVSGRLITGKTPFCQKWSFESCATKISMGLLVIAANVQRVSATNRMTAMMKCFVFNCYAEWG